MLQYAIGRKYRDRIDEVLGSVIEAHQELLVVYIPLILVLYFDIYNLNYFFYPKFLHFFAPNNIVTY